jgi:hypothetical protein
VASQKNILKYFCSKKTTHNAINKGCHIEFYGSNVGNLLHSNNSKKKNEEKGKRRGGGGGGTLPFGDMATMPHQ